MQQYSIVPTKLWEVSFPHTRHPLSELFIFKESSLHIVKIEALKFLQQFSNEKMLDPISLEACVNFHIDCSSKQLSIDYWRHKLNSHPEYKVWRKEFFDQQAKMLKERDQKVIKTNDRPNLNDEHIQSLFNHTLKLIATELAQYIDILNQSVVMEPPALGVSIFQADDKSSSPPKSIGF